VTIGGIEMVGSIGARIDVELGTEQDPDAAIAKHQAEISAATPSGVLLTPPEMTGAGTARQPDEQWSLGNGRRYYRDPDAAGTAAAYYAHGHQGLTKPIIIADGFNYGRSDLAGLWKHLNEPSAAGKAGFLDELLTAGIDVILLGFNTRHTYIQANAGVAISCIRRTLQERTGDGPLIVGGVSMGGLITRYALAAMEHEGEDHQTVTYLSVDSPHNGAWVPVVLQQLAYFFEHISPPTQPGKPRQADLIRSPAAQQLLWGWVENSRYSGPVATASPLRGEFLDDLTKLGWFPSRPRLLGVANGMANGTGNGVPADHEVFDWTAIGGLIGATVRTQPGFGTRQPVGQMHMLGAARRSFSTQVPPFDGAPGGTLPSYGMLADAIGAPIEDRFRAGCFVPSISAVALDFDPLSWPIDLHTDISTLNSGTSALDDFACDTTNSPHSTITATLADWMLTRIT
jgi:hypothetical protein